MEHYEIMEQELHLLEKPRSCRAKLGFVWLKSGFSLFFKRIGVWLAMWGMMTAILSTLFYAVIMLVLKINVDENNFISFKIISLSLLVMFLTGLLWNLFAGGLMASVASLAEKDDLSVAYLFRGFQNKFLPILQFTLMMFAVLFVLGGVLGLLHLPIGNWVIMSLAVLMWFVMPLMVLHDMLPIQAMKMSISGCRNNIEPILVYVLIALLLGSIVSAFIWITLMSFSNMERIGTMIWGGVIGLTVFCFMIQTFAIYTAYRDVWTNLPMNN